MPSLRVAPLLCSTLIVAFSAVLPGCSRPEPAARETPAPTAKEVSFSPRQPADFSPPEPSEVREAVARVYRNLVTLEENRGTGFIAGDFNGDGSQDIAVGVKPAARMLSKS